MAAVAAIVTFTVLGLPLAIALDRRASGGLLVGLSFLYGSGLVYLVMLALSLAGIRWSLFLVNAIAIVVSVGAYARATGAASPAGVPGGRRLMHPLDALTLVVLVAYAIYATLARPWEWDFWAIWGLKGRVFFESGGIDWRFLQSLWNDFTHPDYPLLLPLNFVYVALVNGAWDDRWLGFLFVAFGGALVLVVRDLAGREMAPAAAAAIALASTSFGLTHQIGPAEGPLVAYGAVALLLIRHAVVANEGGAMRQGAILLGLAGSCKNEGMALIAVAALAFAIVAPRPWRWLLRLWPAVAIAVPWLILRAAHSLHLDLASGSLSSRLVERLGAAGAIFAALRHELPDPWLWIAILAALLVVPHSLRRRERFMLAVVAIQITLYIAVYFATPHDVMWHIVTSWPRLSRHIGVPLLFVTLTMLANLWSEATAPAHSAATVAQPPHSK